MDDKGLYIVTGATGGIGRALTEGLCRKGLRVVMACRNMEKAEAVRQGIMRSGRAGNGEITVRTLDMASLGSIGRFAEELRSEGAEIAALVNNAGVMSARFGLTADGIEQCMGVNYVGPYALTRLLLPMIADGGRIVNTLDRSPTFRARAATVRTFQELRLVEAGAAAVHARAGPANGGTHRRLRGRPGRGRHGHDYDAPMVRPADRPAVPAADQES